MRAKELRERISLQSNDSFHSVSASLGCDFGYSLISVIVEYQTLIRALIFLHLPVCMELEHRGGGDRPCQRLRIVKSDFVFQRVVACASQALNDMQRIAVRRNEIECRGRAKAYGINEQ